MTCNDKSESAISTESCSQNSHQQRSLSESEYFSSRSKIPRYDPGAENMLPATFETKKYHRLIEKRRRDRINECIYQLKGLLPIEIIKATSKPMEKAVILELVVKYIQSISSQKNSRSQEYVKGYRECGEKTMEFLNTIIDEKQRDALQKYIDQNLSENTSSTTTHQTADSKLSIPLSGSGPSMNSVSGIPKPGSAFYARFHKNTDVQSTSSSSLESSSPVSDLSLCADNSDSSGCYEMNNQPYSGKRKLYQHHHKSSASHTLPPQPAASTGQAQMFVNMPVMFSPGMMPTSHFINADGNTMNTDTQMPQAVQPFTISAPTGVVVPQMCSDANRVQFPTFFMACGSQPRNDNQGQHQTQMEPMVMQPTMMMPLRNQGNLVFMPSYPMMPQFQAPAMAPVQTQAEGGSNTQSE